MTSKKEMRIQKKNSVKAIAKECEIEVPEKKKKK